MTDKELAETVGSLSVSGRVVTGDELAQYLAAMTPADKESLLKDLYFAQQLGMLPKINADQLHILQYSLGVNRYGKGSRYRNRFVTGPGSDDWNNCQQLVKFGYMHDHGALSLAAGDHCFTVSQEGVRAMEVYSEKA